MSQRQIEKVIISRTDSIGDVILTLPVAGALKKFIPGIHVIFLGKNYTQPVIQACRHVDEFISRDDFLQLSDPGIFRGTAIIHVFPVKEIARQAEALSISLRVGTSHRIYHWFTCNKLLALGRKRSDLHESQLNLKLLKAIGIDREFTEDEIPSLYGFENIETLDPQFAGLLSREKYNLVLHPRSQGSSIEWGDDNFIALANLLDASRYQVFISGSMQDKEPLKPLIDALPGKVKDISGLMPLGQFISFLKECDGIVANSTGPLHIGAALGINAFGVYPPSRPIHPGRWKPIGKKAKTFVFTEISPATIHQAIEATLSI